MALVQVVDFLNQVNELKVAKSLLDTFKKYSNNLEQYDTLGMLYEKIKAYPESLEMLEKCLVTARTLEELYSIRANLAKVYNHVNEPLKSLTYSDINLKINPNDYEAIMEQSFSYYLYGDSKKSQEIQNNLLKIENLPDNVKKRISFNMGTFDMENGKFKQGLYKMIMKGKEIGVWKSPKRPYEKWDGKKTEKTILVFAEAGIGDEIINIRFIKEIESRGMKAIWVGNDKTHHRLFAANGFNVCSIHSIPSGNYVYCESMSLPILLDLNEDQLWSGPYIKPKQEYIDKWKSILPEKFITIRWAGNPYYDQDLHRTVDFQKLFNAVKSLNLPIVSLQIDDNKRTDEGIINVDIKDWDDTIAIQYLALTNITSCTSTAHSASSIGANCIVLTPICIYYPWVKLKDDNTSYWYGENTKIFHQKTWKDWSFAIDNMMKYLEDSINTIYK
jgi:tetratricopeptide (TPR) repeat protein